MKKSTSKQALTVANYDVIEKKGAVPIKAWTRGVPVESAAVDQLVNVARLPFVHKWVAAMPDVHYGRGATIGSVIPTKAAIIPAAVGVDLGCFTGETLVPLVDGKQYPIKELAESGREIIVFACTPTHPVVAARATAKLTRRDAPLVKVTLDNGEAIRCTPDHQFMLRNGSYAEAKDLTPGTSLMPFYSETDKDGYRLVQQPDSGWYQKAHWIVAQHGYNHQVVSVEVLEEREDVYCLTVPEYHNFALAAGVFVHNCGMVATRTSLKAEDLPDGLGKVRSAIEAAVPHGRTEKGGRNDKGAWGTLPAPVEKAWRKLAPGYQEIIEKYPALDRGQTLAQLGTLGTGNHFIEVCLDEADRVWIMLHSGSRGVGNRIGTHFIDLAKKDLIRQGIDLPDQDLAYLAEGSPHFDDYWFAVAWAQDFAYANRQIMLDSVIAALQKSQQLPKFKVESDVVNCHHNYVALENHYGELVYVTRKGAVRAGEGELGIIPGSMGAKSYIVRGKGNPESFESCSHGAGRAMSRGEAKRRFTVEDHIAATQGVECRKDAGVLDESPGAYKSIEAVMAAQADLVDVVHTLKQVVCVKG